MKLFISGDHSPSYIENTLEYIDEIYSIHEICGSMASPCMKVIIPWAESVGIPISLHFPQSLSKRDIMKSNTEIINIERPAAVLIYSEDEDVEQQLISDASDNPYVHYVMKEVK